MLFICYPKCTTCKKAQKWLDDNGLSYTLRDIKAENPTAEELMQWQRMSGLPSGQLYRELQLSKRLPDMPEDEQLALLTSDGMLVKRPILVTEQTVLVGFKEAEWSKMK